MKIIHISDIHIQSEAIMRSDPVANFRTCVHHVMAEHGDADLVVITGDLTHHGTPEAYTMLQTLLTETGLVGLNPRLLIGNHDDRKNFRTAFPDSSVDKNGFIQWVEDTPQGRVIFLDTAQPGTHAGHYCKARQAWLREVLENTAADGAKAMLFMHHNPLPVHVANADQLGIVQEAEFQAIIGDHAPTLRHIFFGHAHFTLSGSLHGVPLSAPRSTSHPNWPDFSGGKDRCGFGGLAQNYNVAFVDDAKMLVHSIDFMAADAAIWVETETDGWIVEKAPM